MGRTASRSSIGSRSPVRRIQSAQIFLIRMRRRGNVASMGSPPIPEGYSLPAADRPANRPRLHVCHRYGRRAQSDRRAQVTDQQCPLRLSWRDAVVQLSNTMMPTAYGLKPRPEFKVIGWRNKNDKAAPLLTQNSQGQPSEIEPPFNDQIPSADEELIPWA